VPTPYNDELFFWWHRQVIAIDDYPYGGIKYTHNLNMPFPLGFSFGDIGITFLYISFFLCVFQLK
jgi:hypothetical protein